MLQPILLLELFLLEQAGALFELLAEFFEFFAQVVGVLGVGRDLELWGITTWV